MGESVDLHLHSTCSDGLLAPADIVAHAAAQGVQLLALTDHDTVAGLEAAKAAAGTLGVRFVAGVELSASWKGRTLHVLGLDIDPTAPALAAQIHVAAERRAVRARAIRDRLERAHAPGQAAYELALAMPGLVTRTHFARALVALGAARDLGTAFERYLRQGRPGYAPADWAPLDAAVDAIRTAGGVAVLAHPLRYTLSAGQRRSLLTEFRTLGGTGIEVAVGGAHARHVELATGLALRAGLEGSCGSDCHDPALPWQTPGRLAKLSAAMTPVWHRWQASQA
jgi:predicted metal-dependent phosphoesterase TrpH